MTIIVMLLDGLFTRNILKMHVVVFLAWVQDTNEGISHLHWISVKILFSSHSVLQKKIHQLSFLLQKRHMWRSNTYDIVCFASNHSKEISTSIEPQQRSHQRRHKKNQGRVNSMKKTTLKYDHKLHIRIMTCLYNVVHMRFICNHTYFNLCRRQDTSKIKAQVHIVLHYNKQRKE